MKPPSPKKNSPFPDHEEKEVKLDDPKIIKSSKHSEQTHQSQIERSRLEKSSSHSEHEAELDSKPNEGEQE